MKKSILFAGAALLSASITCTPIVSTFASEIPESLSTPITVTDSKIIDNQSSSEETVEPLWFFEKTYVVTGDNVNIRTGAGTNYTSVGKLYKGDIIKVKSIDKGWAKFKYEGQYRYVSANYIKEA